MGGDITLALLFYDLQGDNLHNKSTPAQRKKVFSR